MNNSNFNLRSLNLRALKRDWWSNPRADLLAGAVVGLALIPEAIAFSIIAGVDPKVGLYASFIIAVVTAFLGGRPGSISAATGAMALLMIDLVRDYGLEYLLVATLLCGVFQVIFGLLRLARQMRYVPRAVMVGYINALAVLIFLAQLPQLTNVPFAVYVMTALSLAIIYILPRFTKALPSPLVALFVMTVAAIFLGIDVPTVGDMGELPTTLPIFALPQVPWSLETLRIVLPTSLTMAVVGLLASFLTASLVDELTDTPSDKNREAKGQGIANIITSFFGGMAGCGMIGQSVINVQSGGRGRLSTLCAGMFLLFAILVLSRWVQQMPMAALVAVMIMVSIGTFRWASFRDIAKIPRTETAVMLTTMLVTIFTRNFALGVATGIVMSTVFFSRKIAQLVFVDKVLRDDDRHRVYSVSGQIFFVSIEEFLDAFDFEEFVDRITIDLTHAHLWDQGAVAALDKVVNKFRRAGAEVEVVGLNAASATLVNKLAIHSQPSALQD
ncbi:MULTISPECIES: SulP family inorganic anion transporter [Cyanophyceae]|uniref:SulP family inorganic anion transporter n=1 Tax=unclassified Leptolyngbya TaxID=2650499 RepID=UPI001685DF47|nr:MULTISPECIES: SulP family inorganic anion transporter [Cyanophyceae]MBD1916561.1 SulP family inorganic anion transporter [Phormidium sp. FACHB-77]MBD2032128.1 SulP family inorganic anion transporter [Phormidium sp. FACHB-322]MBD2053008.1 SulP family inorganic anion transporter [Leptolyngbya sp. FACHB-60]